MEDRLSAREIGAYIELKKRVAEEEYKLNYIRNTAGDHSALIDDIENDLREDRAKMKIIEGKMEAKNLKLVVPNQGRIEEYTELISRLPRDEVHQAIKHKSGDSYIYLSERGKLIKRNMENKNEIGKLNVLAANASPEVRKCVHEALRKGEAGESEANFEGENGEKIINPFFVPATFFKVSGRNLQVFPYRQISKYPPIVGYKTNSHTSHQIWLQAGTGFPFKLYKTLFGWRQPHNTFHGRAFAGTVPTQKADNLTRFHRQRNTKKNMAKAIISMDIL